MCMFVGSTVMVSDNSQQFLWSHGIVLSNISARDLRLIEE